MGVLHRDEEVVGVFVHFSLHNFKVCEGLIVITLQHFFLGNF
jgi:hypothetical protein